MQPTVIVITARLGPRTRLEESSCPPLMTAASKVRSQLLGRYQCPWVESLDVGDLGQATEYCVKSGRARCAMGSLSDHEKRRAQVHKVQVEMVPGENESTGKRRWLTKCGSTTIGHLKFENSTQVPGDRYINVKRSTNQRGEGPQPLGKVTLRG